MTVEELFEVVKDVPPAAWPPEIVWHHVAKSPAQFYRKPCVEYASHQRVPTRVAEQLFEASMARYLDDHEHHWTRSRYNGGITIYSACMGTEAKRLGDGRGVLQALATACKGLHPDALASPSMEATSPAAGDQPPST